jgi:cell division protease FtsH
VAGIALKSAFDHAFAWYLSGPSSSPPQDTKIDPNINLDTIVCSSDMRAALRQSLELFVAPGRYASLNVHAPKGILLYGPPGNGKTHIARAMAGELLRIVGDGKKCQFIAINATEFRQKYLGESGRRVRELFEQARKADMSVIFIDEIDAIGADRQSNPQEYPEALLELLCQMDGFARDSNILVIAATNIPKKLDAALIRAGRFDEHIYIPLPDVTIRAELFRLYLQPVDHVDIDIEELARLTHNCSCADIKEMVQKAARTALARERMCVTMDDFMGHVPRQATSAPARRTHR